MTKDPPSRHDGNVTVGLLLNAEHAQKVLETGPPADDPEVRELLVQMMSRQNTT